MSSMTLRGEQGKLKKQPFKDPAMGPFPVTPKEENGAGVECPSQSINQQINQQEVKPEIWVVNQVIKSIMNDHKNFSFYSKCVGKLQLLGFYQKCDMIWQEHPGCWIEIRLIRAKFDSKGCCCCC